MPSLKRSTPSAPWFWALSAFNPKSQVPRWITATLPARLSAPAGKSASSQPELEALACAVGSVKSMIAIGPVNEPDPENSMVKKSWFTTQAGFAGGVAVSSGSASSVNTIASKGWVVTVQ